MFVVVVDSRRLTMKRNFSWKSAFVGFVFVHWHSFKFDKLSTLSTSSLSLHRELYSHIIIDIIAVVSLTFILRVHTSALYYFPLWVYVQWSGKHETTTSKYRNNNTNIFTQANKKFLIHPVFLLHISIIFSLTLFRGIFYFVFYLIFFSRWTRTIIPCQYGQYLYTGNVHFEIASIMEQHTLD
jgi:hypothetical protein